MDKYQCRCQYVYDPASGDQTQSIPAGTPFEKLPETWVCPLCGLEKKYFVREVGKPTSESGHPMIKVTAKCFSTLQKAETCDYKGGKEYELFEGSNIHDLVEKLEIPLEAILLVFLNHKVVDFQTVLKNGDQVAFSPKTGAM